MCDNGEFQRLWEARGEIQGGENDVYFDEATQRWTKRNNLSHHGSWLEFFQRVQLHSYLFAEAPLTLEGFVEHEEELLPIVSQPDVPSVRGATEGEVELYMREFGFRKVGDPTRRYDYINEERGIRADDLHDENVLIIPDGSIVVIDPSPSMAWESKMERLRAEFLT